MCAVWAHEREHLLVLTHCTTGKHHKQLHLYDNQYVLYQVNLPGGMERPLAAMNSASDLFVVVGRHGVWWIDQQGQVLQHYGQQPGKLPDAGHIIQHSKGSPLFTVWEGNETFLLSNEATLLQDLFSVQHPSLLQLDEEASLLFAARWKNQNNAYMEVFQLCLKTTRKVCLQDQG